MGEPERVHCQLCGVEHEVIGVVGGVKIVSCERVRDFGHQVMAVAIPAVDEEAAGQR